MWRLDAEEEENDICVPKIVEKRRNCDCQQLIGNPHCNSQSNNRPNTRCESDTYCDFQINRQSIADRIPIIEDTGRVKINGMVWISRRIARQCNDIPDNCMENKRTHRCNRSTDHRSTCFNCNILCDRASQCSPLHDTSAFFFDLACRMCKRRTERQQQHESTEKNAANRKLQCAFSIFKPFIHAADPVCC